MRTLAIFSGCVFIAACNPIPTRSACLLPDFGSAAVDIHASYKTSGYFEASCPRAAPKEFSVRSGNAIVDVNVLMAGGTRLYFRAKTGQGEPLEIEGNKVYRMPEGQEYTYHAPLDLPAQKEIVLSLRTHTGQVLEQLRLAFGSMSCTCPSYDAI